MTTAKGESTRRRLLDAATEELLLSSGDIELAAVAKRADLSGGAPYRHFKSRSELMRTLVDDFYDRFETAVFKLPLSEIESWHDREVERTRQFVRFFYNERAAPVLLSMLAGDGDVVRAQALRIDRAKAAAAKNIQRGQKAGAIPASLDPVLAGAAVIGGFLHGVSTALSRTPRVPMARVSEAMCRFMVAALELTPQKKLPR